MATKSKGAGKSADPKKAAVKVTVGFPDPEDKEMAQALADAALRPSVNGAAVVSVYGKATLGELDMGSLVASLLKDIDSVWAGDMKRAEAMLYGQAQALQAIFTNLARRASHQEYLKQWEAHLRMALKAQAQCRMTLETLAIIKNPPVVFARQANINNGGQQQVNNEAPGVSRPIRAPAPAGTSANAPTELLEESDGQRLDPGAARAAGGADSHLATVGEVNRPADGSR